MSWVQKKAVVSFIRDIGGNFSEFQHEFTWYGRAKFASTGGAVHCDYTLAGSDGIRREDPIVGFKQDGEPRFIDSDLKRAAYESNDVRILACKAAIQWNPKLDGEPADKHAVQILKIAKGWDIARVKIKPRYIEEQPINIWYLCVDNRITSLPSI